jgi:lipopolysaccharide transport system ATP-binding protein
MADIALEMDSVFKKFKRGENYDSLRDLIPGIIARHMRKGQNNMLEKKEFWALQNISFAVKQGESFGIMGNNGAGKSTILKLLSRVMQPDKGALRVKGRLSALIEVGAGFHPDLTGRENIFLNGTILGMKKNEIQNKFDEIVEFSELSDFIDSPVKRYSSGMFARLGFSVAAHIEPDILIIDEVLSVGDYAFQNKCSEKMKSILKGGATVIFVSHNLRVMSELCTRSILLNKGEIIKEGPTIDVVNYYLEMGRTGSKEDKGERDVFISRAVLSGENGELNNFRAGQKVYLNLEITARKSCKNLSLGIVIYNDQYYDVFNTSSQRLMHSSFSMDEGEAKSFQMELHLHLVSGTYNLRAHVNRYDINKVYDICFPAATFNVSSDHDVKGVADLYPNFLQLA